MAGTTEGEREKGEKEREITRELRVCGVWQGPPKEKERNEKRKKRLLENLQKAGKERRDF